MRKQANIGFGQSIDLASSTSTELNISLEFEDGSGNPADMYAVMCKVDYGLTQGATTDFSNSGLGTPNVDMMTLGKDYPNGHMIVAATRVDMQNQNFKRQIC